MPTLKECLNNFFFHCTYEKNLSMKTLKAYGIDLKQFTVFLKQAEEEISIDQVDKILLRDYLKVISDGNKPKTIKRKLATLKAFFNYLEFEDVIVVNPFRKMRISIKEGTQLPRTIPTAKIVSLFKHVYRVKEHTGCCECHSYKRALRDIAVLELLFSTGVRVAELCNLQKDNIDLNRGTIKIVGKGNRERLIPLCNIETVKAAKDYFEYFRAEISKSGYFFINRLNSRLSEQSVRFMIKKHIRALKLTDNITPHMFRHSIATLLLEGGVDIRYIQNMLGHSSINTTQIYVQVNEKAQRRILKKRHPRGSFMKIE